MISHLFLVEWAVANVTFECPREIPLVVKRHPQAQRVEEIVLTPPVKVQHLAHEPINQVKPPVRLQFLLGEYGAFCHLLVPDRTEHMVRVELQLAPLLILWRRQCFSVRLVQERHSRLESHFHKLDWCSRRRQIVDCVRDARPSAE